MARELSRCQKIEQSIVKKYRKELWTPFMQALSRYELIKTGDKIAVCISGGKDSMLLAKLMQQLQRHSKIPFELVFLSMDPGYSPENRKKIEENANILELPLVIFESDVFAVADGSLSGNDPSCYLCARMRRGHLYAKAKELCCNKIALGHHLNDAIETCLISMFYGAQLQTMIPKAHSENFEGMELIRPLYGVREEDILAWARYNELTFLRCACRFTEEARAEENSKRRFVKELIAKLREENPDLESNLFHALHKVHIETFPGYKAGGSRHSFLEWYIGDGSDCTPAH